MYGNIAESEASETKRSTEVQSEMERLTSFTEQLDKHLTDLENRLSPILVQTKVGDDGTNKSVPEPLRVALAETLHVRGTHVERLRERVSSMIARLEL